MITTTARPQAKADQRAMGLATDGFFASGKDSSGFNSGFTALTSRSANLGQLQQVFKVFEHLFAGVLGSVMHHYVTKRIDQQNPGLVGGVHACRPGRCCSGSNPKPLHQAVFLAPRSEEHTSELQSRPHLVCRLLLEKKKT